MFGGLKKWLEDRAKNVTNVASKAVDQINPLDSGRSWQTRNPSQQQMQSSALRQGVNQGATVGKAIVRSPVQGLNTAKTGLEATGGLIKIGASSLFGSDQDYENTVNQVWNKADQQLKSGGAFGMGGYFKSAQEAANATPRQIAGKSLNEGFQTATMFTPQLKLAKNPLTSRVIQNATESALGSGLGQYVETGKVDPKQVLRDTAAGTALGEAGNLGQKFVRSAAEARKTSPNAELETNRIILRDMKAAEMRAKGKDRAKLAKDTIAQQIKVRELQRNLSQGGYVELPGKKPKKPDSIKTKQGSPDQSSPQAIGRTEAPQTNLSVSDSASQGIRISSALQPAQAQTPQLQVGLRTRGFIETVLNDPNTSPKVKDSIQSVYKIRNTKELQTKAATLVRENGDLAERIAQQANDDVSVAVGAELIKKYQKAGDYERAIDLTERMAQDLTEAGRTVQAASIYGRLTPEGVLRFAQREINKFNKATKSNVKLSPEQAKRLTELSSKIQEMTDGYDKQRAIAKLITEVQQTVPATVAEKLSTLQTMAQLLNPKTNIRNIGGNTLFAGIENVSQTVGAPVDALLSMFTKTRTSGLPSILTQTKSAKAGLSKGVKEAMQGINTGANTQYDLNSVPVFRQGVLQKLEKTMNATLRGADRAAYEAAFDDTVRSMVKAQKLTSATPEILETAHHQGLYRTFQDKNAISDFFVNMKRSLNNVGIGVDGKRFGLGDVVLKYPKTPANLLARGIDYSPAGMVKAVFEASKPLVGKEFNQRAFVDAFSRAVVGSSAAFGTGFLLAKNGIITAQPEENKDMRNLQKTAGLGGYQINASALKRWVMSGFSDDAAKLRPGDQLVSYDWAQPMAVPVSAGAALGTEKPSRAGKEAASTIASSANTLVEQPLLQGVQRLFGGYGSLTDSALEAVKSAPASFVPTLSNQINQLFDNNTRNIKDDNAFAEATNLVKSKIPGLAQTLPVAVDVLGNDKERFQNGSNNPFNVFLNPAFVSNYNPSNAANTSLELYQKTGEMKQAPNTAANKIKINGQDKKLSAQEQGDLQRYIGTNNKDTFDVLQANSFFSPRFNQLPDGDKVDLLASIQSDVNTAAKIKLFGDTPERVSEAVQSIVDNNLPRAIELKLSNKLKTLQPKGLKVSKKKSSSKGRRTSGRSRKAGIDLPNIDVSSEGPKASVKISQINAPKVGGLRMSKPSVKVAKARTFKTRG